LSQTANVSCPGEYVFWDKKPLPEGGLKTAGAGYGCKLPCSQPLPTCNAIWQARSCKKVLREILQVGATTDVKHNVPFSLIVRDGRTGRVIVPRRGLGLRPSAATGRLQVGSCGSGELFFTCAFLLAASSSCEGGEKRTTAKNKNPELPSGQKHS
jgi:hypothetical protein